MQNFKNRFNRLTVTAAADTASGAFVQVGAAIFGVAVNAALNGKPLVLAVDEAVYSNAPKATGAAWAIGDILYWDNTAKNFTKTATNNIRVAVATAVAQSADAVGEVGLVGLVLT